MQTSYSSLAFWRHIARSSASSGSSYIVMQFSRSESYSSRQSDTHPASEGREIRKQPMSSTQAMRIRVANDPSQPSQLQLTIDPFDHAAIVVVREYKRTRTASGDRQNRIFRQG